jgi:hypothetical protein
MQKSHTKFVVSGAVAIVVASFFIAPLTAGEEVVSQFEPGFAFEPKKGFQPPFTNLTAGPPIEFGTVSNQATERVTRSIEGVYAFCLSVGQQEYLVDCLGAGLADLADELPNTGDYAEAKVILENAAVKLRALAQANASPTLPKARLSGTINNTPVRTKRLTPVKTEAVSSTAVQAAAILEEAETLLLRSTSNSDRRKVHYAQMAQAIGSQKILLRSL